MLEQDTI